MAGLLNALDANQGPPMEMTPAQRRATFPLDSYDVPVQSLIYR